MRWLLTLVGRPSLFARPLSVTWSYLENQTRYSHSYYVEVDKICSNINWTSCTTWRQATVVVNRAWPSSHRRCCQLLTAEFNRRNLSLTLIVCYIANTSGMTRRLKGGRPASYCNDDILVTIIMMGYWVYSTSCTNQLIKARKLNWNLQLVKCNVHMNT